MIICIAPLEQWSGNIDPDNFVFLELPDGVDPDKECAVANYGENHNILVEHFVQLGAKILPESPFKMIYV